MIKSILLVLALWVPTTVLAADVTTSPVQLRVARLLHLKCVNVGGLTTDFIGSSQDLSVTRVIANEIGYEIARDGFFLASCAAVLVVE